MRLWVESSGSDNGRLFALRIEDPTATIADLATALQLPETAVAIDGVIYLGDTTLGSVPLVEGSRVGPPGPYQAARSTIGKSWVGVSAGPEAGAVRRLQTDGVITIGRNPRSDLQIKNSSVSDQHAALRRCADGLTIEDLGSTNGTWISNRSITGPSRINANEDARIGSSSVTFKPVKIDDKPLATSHEHADRSGRILFNRPPRSPVAEPRTDLELPKSLPERKNPTLAIAAIIVPLLIATALVAIFGSWRFAIFALLSPLMALGTWLSGRRAVKKATDGDVASRRNAISILERKVADSERHERTRRRAIGPDLLEVRRRVELPSNRLWERRLTCPDALTFRLGLGSVPWQLFMPNDSSTKKPINDDADLDQDLKGIVDGASNLDTVEVLASLSAGPLGIVGKRSATAAAARSALLQLATHHGPADISVAVLTNEQNVESWEWTQWLPHSLTSTGGARLFWGDGAREFARQLRSGARGVGQGIVLLVDDLDLLHERDSAIRAVLDAADGVYGIVLADVVDQLPASTRTIVTALNDDGEFIKGQPANPDIEERGILDGASGETAAEIARAMARFEDPDVPALSGSLPERVEPPEVVSTHKLFQAGSGLVVPIGLSAEGVFEVDLVSDGPHALIAGTTGSGKSEFLRSMIIGLACNYSPDDLVFVLIDYKGGSAFDRCAALPHVVGLVTDLDDHLAARALDSLEAELRFRETMLRDAGVDNIEAYHASSATDPLPRLVVAIDEFATMRAEVDGFVGSLVGIAQRGRSLGVHLVLATQRPSGAVDANIAANTNLRVALRVQSTGDSADVISDPIAASIDRSLPGRAFVRRGQSDLVEVQTQYVSGSVSNSGPKVMASPVFAGPQGVIPPTKISEGSSAGSPGGASHLDQLVELCSEQARRYGAPRLPWLPELPGRVDELALIEELNSGDGAHIALALADDPSHQRRVLLGWNLDDGHLAVVGRHGSGVTTTLRSTICALGSDPDRTVWVFAVDHNAGGLQGIDRLDHVAEVIQGSDIDRQERLLSFVSNTFADRRDSGFDQDEPLIVIAIDGLGSFCESNSIDAVSPNGELLKRIGRDGPALGVYLLLGGVSRNEIPRELRQSVPSTIVLEQIDQRGYLDLGLSTTRLPNFVPGRAVMGVDGLVGHIIDWEHIVEHGDLKLIAHRPPPAMVPLSSTIERSVLPQGDLSGDVHIPFAIFDSTREPAELVLRPSEHALIVGPARSGRSNTLAVIAAQIRDADPGTVIVGIHPSNATNTFNPSLFDAGGSVDELDSVLCAALDGDSGEKRWVVLVDDADRIDLHQGALMELAQKPRANVTVIAAVRASSIRQNFGHWTRQLRSSGVGLLLEPDPSVDGELFSLRLPKSRLAAVAGRGYLVSNGEFEVVQVAVQK